MPLRADDVCGARADLLFVPMAWYKMQSAPDREHSASSSPETANSKTWTFLFSSLCRVRGQGQREMPIELCPWSLLPSYNIKSD